MKFRQICASAIMLVLCAVAAGQEPDIAALKPRAGQGDAQSQVDLGLRYLMADDAVAGAQWIRRSADQGHAAAQDILSDAAGQPKSRHFLETPGSELSDAEKAEVNRRVEEWLRTHDLRGCGFAGSTDPE